MFARARAKRRAQSDSESSESSESCSSDEQKKTKIAYQEELDEKTALLNKTLANYDKLQKKYESLLGKVEKNERSQKRRDEQPESDDLVEWTKTWETVISMMLKIVPFKSVKPKTPSDQREILVEVVTGLCERVSDPKDSREYQALSKKYEKNKRTVRRMKEQCSELLGEVQRNRTILEKHMREVRAQERTALDERVEQLEQLIQSQIKQQNDMNDEHSDSLDLMEGVQKARTERLKMGDNDSAEDLLVRSRITRKTARKYTGHHHHHRSHRQEDEKPRKTVTFTDEHVHSKYKPIKRPEPVFDHEEAESSDGEERQTERRSKHLYPRKTHRSQE